MADQISTGSSTGSTLWKTMNSVGTLATLGAALGISIPALVKANDAQDQKIYTDNVNFDNYKSQVAYQEATNAKLAALDKENALLKQAQEFDRAFNGQAIANVYAYSNATFMKGQLYLPSQNVTPLPMDRYNSWCAPTAPTVEATSASNG